VRETFGGASTRDRRGALCITFKHARRSIDGTLGESYSTCGEYHQSS
jgi:hypothetical protein